MDIKLLIVRIGSGLLGLIALISGGKAIWGGIDAHLGEVAATLDPNVLNFMDNEYRFFAGVWLLIGFALIIGSLLIHKKPDLIQVGLEAVFVGGIARVIGAMEYGLLRETTIAIAIEIIAPIVLLVLFKIATKSSAKDAANA